MTETLDGATFAITRVFDAPRQRVWDAWTKPEQVSQWLGPKGTKVTVKTFDLRPGGMQHAKLEGPDGAMWGKHVYREVHPPSRLVWVHSFSNENAEVVRAPFSQTWPLEMLTTVIFEDEGAKTRVTLTWVPFYATEEERQTFAAALSSMDQGWTGSFDQLDQLLAGAP